MADIKEEPPVEYICILPAFEKTPEDHNIKQEIIDSVSNLKHYCFICNKTFQNQPNLHQHLQLHRESLKCPTCFNLVPAHKLLKHIKNHDLKKRGPKFPCYVCDRKFYTANSLKTHSSGHITVYDCDYCGIKLRRKCYLATHLRRHLQPNRRHCEKCNRKFFSAKELSSHKKTFHPSVCSICEKEFRNVTKLKQHLLSHVKASCPICFKSCSAGSIRAHTMLHKLRSQKERFECSICGRKFLQKHPLRSHLIWHLKPFECDLCGKRLGNKQQMKIHIMWHLNGDTSVDCKICGKKFVKVFNLKKHTKNHHKTSSYYQCDQCPHKSWIRSRFTCHMKIHRKFKMSKCRLCSFTSPNKLLIMKHQFKEHHGRYCKTCDAVFQSDKGLETHMSNHEKYPGMKCTICGMQFKNFSNAPRHMAMHLKVTDVEGTTCTICSAKFPTVLQAHKHVELVHKQTEKSRCRICGKTILNKSAIKNHMRRVHDKAFKDLFKCDQCGKHFSTKKGFDYHMMTHAGEFPFPCNICPRKFREKKILKNHFESEHLDKKNLKVGYRKGTKNRKELIKHLKCDKCGDEFESKKLLSDHLLDQIENMKRTRAVFLVVERLMLDKKKKI